MRPRLVIALVAAMAVVAVRGSARGDAPPMPIERAIEVAAARGKPLLVELSATWCGPCKELEQIMDAPEVVAARRRVVMVRYDVDTTAGAAVARRFGSEGVPAFVAVDGQGRAFARQRGLGGRGRAELIRWFVAFVKREVVGGGELAKLEARVAAHPDALANRLALGRRYEELARIDDALAAYDTVAFAYPASAADTAVVALAAAAHADLAGGRARTEAALAEAEAFVRRYPGAPDATARLALIIVAGRRTAAQVEELLALRREAASDPTAAVRLALLADRQGIAMRVADELGPANRTEALFAQAEIALDRGRIAEARALIAPTCAAPSPIHPARCLMIESPTDRRGSPAVIRLREQAEATLAELAHPGARTRSWLNATDLDGDELGDAIATALRDARRRCTAARSAARLSVDLHLADGGGAHAVHVQPADTPAGRCVRDVLRTATLPAAPGGRMFYTSLDLPATEVAVAQRRPPVAGTVPPIGRGLAAFVSQRLGAVDDLGVGLHALADGGSWSTGARYLFGGELEGGVDRDGGGTFAARALIGFGIGNGRSGLMGLTGVGASGAGETAPRALEVPIELRLKLGSARYRGHVWLRSRLLFGAPAREPANTDALRIGDSAALGATLSVPSRGGRLLLGVIFDREAAGTTATLRLGIALGDMY